MRRALILAGGLLAACAGDAVEADLSGPTVGLQRVAWVDDSRSNWDGNAPRPLTTTIWYPASDEAVMEAVAFPADNPIFVGGAAALNSRPLNIDAKPVVILSHGTGGSGMQMMWLARELAQDGYLVAAVDHHGNTAAEPAFDARGFRMPWHRAQDLSAVLDKLEADTVWGPHADMSDVTAIGFSLGGYTVAALSGGRLNLEMLADFCSSEDRDATCEPQPEFPDAEAEFNDMLNADPLLRASLQDAGKDYADPRINRFVSIAPAIVQGFELGSVNAADKPFLVIVGDEDRTTPSATNAEVLAAMGKGDLHTIQGADHLSFLNGCTKKGRRFVPACKDGSTDRTAVHAETVRLIREHLKD